ncbi:MAG: beta-ketoacyl synthase N-terminal-like domain-containing protein [Deltaproteobacteria bacterium]|nr:beta-ketoacyl synthase N-terminal-like domain-containing protein [Deltaproteobacteria bacterium]
MSLPIHIAGTSAICSIGTTVPQIWAAARAGISRFAESSVHDRFFAPIRMALLPEDALPEAPPEASDIPLTSRQRRMLRLALPALQQCCSSLPTPAQVPLFLGLPEPSAAPHPIADKPWLSGLAKLSACPIDIEASEAFPIGRAAGMKALCAAITFLAQGPNRSALVGGVDTFLDLRRLAELDAEGRLLGERTMDGFVPGEGAAFVLLTNAPANGPHTAILAAAMADDPGHRYSEAPGKGEGLANAIEAMRTQMPPPAAPAQLIFAGLNGEGAAAKEWGVAHLRHSDLLAPEASLEHPADRFGDVGAAMGTMLLALADAALLQGHREGPALVWASSDREPRGCAWLQLMAS